MKPKPDASTHLIVVLPHTAQVPEGGPDRGPGDRGSLSGQPFQPALHLSGER